MRKFPARRSSPYRSSANYIREKLTPRGRRRTYSAPSSPYIPADYKTMGSLGALQYLKVDSDGVLKTRDKGFEPILHRSSCTIRDFFHKDMALIAKQLAEDKPTPVGGDYAPPCHFSVDAGGPDTHPVYKDLISLLQNHLRQSLPTAVPENLTDWNHLSVIYAKDRSQPVSISSITGKPTVIINVGSDQEIHLQTKDNLIVDVPMPPLAILCLHPDKVWSDIKVVMGHEGSAPDHHFWVSLHDNRTGISTSDDMSTHTGVTGAGPKPNKEVNLSPPASTGLKSPALSNETENTSPVISISSGVSPNSTTGTGPKPRTSPNEKDTSHPAISGSPDETRTQTPPSLTGKRKVSSEIASTKSQITASSANSHISELDLDLFIHIDIAINVINTVRSTTLNKLMEAAQLPRTNSDSYSFWQTLLGHLQMIYERRATPTPSFCSLMIDQLTSVAIERELERLKLECQAGSQLKNKKQVLIDNWCNPAPQPDAIEQDQITTSREKKRVKKREKRRYKKLQKTLSGSSLGSSTGHNEQTGIPETVTESVPEEETASPPERLIVEENTVPPATNPGTDNSRPLKILEKSVLELKTDMANQRNLMDLLIDQEPSQKATKNNKNKILDQEKSLMIEMVAKIETLTLINRSIVEKVEKLTEANVTLVKSVEKLAVQNEELTKELNGLKTTNRSLSESHETDNKSLAESLQHAICRIQALEQRAPEDKPITETAALSELRISNTALQEAHYNTQTRIDDLERQLEVNNIPPLPDLPLNTAPQANNTVSQVDTDDPPLLSSLLAPNLTDGQDGRSSAPVADALSVSQVTDETAEPQLTDPRSAGGAEGGFTARRRIRSARSSGPPAARESYRHHFAIVVHDGLFDGFNPRAFPRYLRLKLVKTKSLKKLATTEIEALIRTVERLNPACVYIHTGWNDAKEATPPHEITEYCRKISEAVLAVPTGSPNICFSTPFHVGTDSSSLADRVEDTSKAIFQFVSQFRSHSDRVYSYTNDELWNFTTTYSGEAGPVLPSCVRGTKLMWASLRNGINKTLRLPNPRNNRSDD